MTEECSVGLLFKEALEEFSEKHKDDKSTCGIKIDLRSQGIDLIVGIRFIDGASHFAVCTGNNNCEGVDDAAFDLLSGTLKNIGVESKSGAAVMIKRNAQVVSTDEGCKAIEAPHERTAKESSKKRGSIFGLFGKK